MDKRNYGIDLLRLLSMYMVVILHILEFGEILNNANGINRYSGWLIGIFAYCAVDCFALISGYVGYKERTLTDGYIKHCTKIIPLWVTVAFYNVLLTIVVGLYSGNIGIGTIVRAAMPISSEAYWYFTAYAGLFLVIPLINEVIRNISGKRLNIIALILFLVFSVYSTVALYFFGDVFKLKEGYSFLWLSFLYFFGAWIKKNHILERASVKKITLAWGGCLLVTWIVYLMIPFGELILVYTSPAVVGMAFFLLCIFREISVSVKFKKILTFMSPAAFGVYLIHNQEMVNDYLIKNAFTWVSKVNPWGFPIVVVFVTFSIFAVCLLIERIRISVFKFCKIDNMISYMQGWIVSSLEK